MGLAFSATDLVPGDIEALRAGAGALRRSADEVAQAQQLLAATVQDSSATWTGTASEGFRRAGLTQVTSLRAAVPAAEASATAYDGLAAALSGLRAEATTVLQRASALGLPAGALTGNPVAVARHLLANPDDTPAVAHLLGLVVSIRVRAGEAHNAFVVAIAAGTSELAGWVEDQRSPDERGGRRIRVDDRTRRGEPGTGHFDNDWAGRAILERYLRGGGDWTIDDEAWSQYMMDNERLRLDMAVRNETEAQSALDAYLGSGRRHGFFDAEFAQSIENGEGIVGYQYLHGTNADVGGFQHSGRTTVTPRSDGTYEVQMDVSYQWNDIIDPNPQYSTDRWKSRLAEILTLGQADPYDIHIRWQEPTTVILDAQGRVISMEGYPG